MSVYVSNLPEYTGNTSGGYSIWNNSGETTTYKVKNYSPFILTGNNRSSIYSFDAIPQRVGDNTSNNFMWPATLNRIDDYVTNSTLLGTNHYLRTDSNAGDAIDNCYVFGNENFLRKGSNVFIFGNNNQMDRPGQNGGGFIFGGASNVMNNCAGNASGIIGGQSNSVQNYGYQNSMIIGCFGNQIIGDVQNSSIFGSQQSQMGNTSYGSAIVGGAAAVINGGGGAMIVGGYGNNVSNTNCSGIYSSRSCNLTNSYEDIGASIFGAWNSSIGAGSIVSTIIGGDGNNISGTSPYSSIIGGTGNAITGNTRVTMLSCSGRTATASATTYVENLHTFRTPSTRVQPISSGTTFTCNLENGAKSQFYITGTNTINITNVRDGASFMIKTQTDGNYVTTWTASGYTFVFEGGLKDPGNNVTDIFVFEVFGSVIYGNRRHNYS